LLAALEKTIAREQFVLVVEHDEETCGAPIT